MAREEEAHLVARARAGDEEAFAEVVRRNESRVRGVVWRLLEDERDLEEVVQDTFVKAWRSLDRFRADASFSTWLYRIAVNEALMRRRQRPPASAELDEARVPGTVDLGQADLQSFLISQLRALPPDYRAPLILRDVEGLSNREVAEVLGVSVAAAKSRIHRARMMVRAALVEWKRDAS
jgi:RNA polymerase sigma-70 factor, ECF subfamily